MKRPIQIYAHRAARGLFPENTIDMSHALLQLDIDFIDFDIGMTKEGHLVVYHDLALNPDITRNCAQEFITSPIPLCELTLEQLAEYNVGQINPKTSYASYFPHQQRLSVAKIPLLKEAIECVLSQRQIHFQIEIKTDPTRPQLTAPVEQFAEALYTLLADANLLYDTEIQSFDFRALLAIQKLDPHIKTSYLTKHACDETLWHAGHCIKDFNNSYPQMIKALGGSCWGPFQMDVTHNRVIEAKQHGVKIVPWGYPEEEGTEFNSCQIRKLIEWGVDGIITDRPDLLLQLLN